MYPENPSLVSIIDASKRRSLPRQLTRTHAARSTNLLNNLQSEDLQKKECTLVEL